MSQVAARRDHWSWRLRAAWATGEAITVRYEARRNEVRQADGYVTRVSSTGEYVLLQLLDDETDRPPLHVPVRIILNVERIGEHFHQGRTRRPPRRPPPDQGVLAGQLGLVEAPPVSDRAMRYALRGAAEMLPPDVLGVLAAVDRAGKRPTVADVAREAGRSERWTATRLRTLERRGYVRRVRRRGRRDILLLG